jgi:hypothetical protein
MHQTAANYVGTNFTCNCLCHRVWGGVIPPNCTCGCWKTQSYTFNGFIYHKDIESLSHQVDSLTNMYKVITLEIARIKGYICEEKFEVDKKDEKVDKENIFEFRTVDNKGRDDIRHIKNVLYDFYCWIVDNVPENKERLIAIQKLEECAMWLNKSISRRKPNERGND